MTRYILAVCVLFIGLKLFVHCTLLPWAGAGIELCFPEEEKEVKEAEPKKSKSVPDEVVSGFLPALRTSADAFRNSLSFFPVKKPRLGFLFPPFTPPDPCLHS
ncbi:MAG TPA: hypothetical protein VHK69_12380 [Chitinophagaceae bacterium]|jgi:hypothetical protein|nr:hypothetical protein [Chitinophagaceae bacterium]